MPTSAKEVARLVTVGGSEVAALCGLDPWTSPTTLAARKLGLVPPVDESEAMRIGRTIEPYIAGLYEETTGTMLAPVGETLRDPERKWCTGRPDYATLPPDEGIVVEVKNVGQLAHRNGWDEGAPLAYQAQCQWYMHLTQFHAARVVALVGGQRLDVYDLERDDDVIAALLEEAEAFVKLLRRGRLPAPDGSDSTKGTLAQLFPDHVAGQVVRAGRKDLEAVEELRHIHDAEATLKTQRLRCENQLKEAMGEAETLIHPNDWPLVHWRTVRYSRIDTTRFKKDRPKLAADYSNTTTTRRFTLA